MVDVQRTIETPPEPCSKQAQNEIRLFGAQELWIKSNTATALCGGDEQARAERCAESVVGADIARTLNPAISAGHSFVIQSPDCQDCILRVRTKPCIDTAQKTSRIPAVIIRECKDGTGRCVHTQVTRRRGAFLAAANVAEVQANRQRV